MRDFDRHDSAWRDPADIVGQWQGAGDTDPELLRHTTTGDWWGAVAEADVTLLVSRETEHLVLALRASARGPRVSFIRLPHPSGIAVDRRAGVVHVASTRNPNQVFDFAPAIDDPHVLMPVRSRYLPGSLYIHDLAILGEALHANAVGQNAVVRLDGSSGYARVWWPRSIEIDGRPAFDLNYLQLNSIAAGPTLRESFFSASSATMSRRRPGHLDFAVDRRGVIFSGETREPVVVGLTRPHSARLHAGSLWVDDSGYGTWGRCDAGRFEVAAVLPGWTRGLSFVGRTAFVGTSHVIRRFRQYAPGIDADHTVCGVHAIDLDTGRVRGSIAWPSGNQIFAIDWIRSDQSSGFPFRLRGGRVHDARPSFYRFETASPKVTARAAGQE
jgi:uncharacterized protein (TIGR03032 family)